MTKKMWEVVKASKDKFTGIGLEGGEFRKFGKQGAFITRDPGEANYIEQAFGSHSKTGDGSVVVCEVSDSKRGKSFTINAPWKEQDRC